MREAAYEWGREKWRYDGDELKRKLKRSEMLADIYFKCAVFFCAVAVVANVVAIAGRIMGGGQ